jgi:MFS family permease
MGIVMRGLTKYQWFVFIVCCMAWDMDCLDQQLFVLARVPAMKSLVPEVKEDDQRLPTFHQELVAKAKEKSSTIPSLAEAREALQKLDIGTAGTNATAFFMFGWAIGGICFGMMGDRVGRVKTLILTILLYAVFTGLSAFSTSTWDFYAYRFLTGLGVGGVFAAAVTLLAETMPDHARPYALGLFQASSVLGNCGAALLSMYLGHINTQGDLAGLTILGLPLTPWRIMFLVGILPALLVVLIQLKLKEPEKWLQSKASGQIKKGLYGKLFTDKKWGKHAVFGLILALSGVVGLWGIGFFSPDLQRAVALPAYQAEAKQLGLVGKEAQSYIDGQGAYWAGITSLVQNLGSFCGIFAFSLITARIGRKPTFAIFLTLAGLMTAFVFYSLKSWNDIFWMVPLMGFFQLALFGGYAIYLPELFPTSLRSTGTSFCYNVGRLVAGGGVYVLGLLSTVVYGAYESPLPLRYAGMTMCLVFILGLLALPFLPETKGKPLPEES